ncbi:hypothetical protein BJV77DRAFT_984201 [Russula vinacea]|nr:hypothetical protein BJV77DRAFT_984201 [Russula vinacea]
MDGPDDTDTLLALICSLLPDNIAPSQQSLLDALLQTEGNQYSNGKRKRNVSLDGWLIRAASSNDANGEPSSPQSRLGSESFSKKPRSANGISTTKIGPSLPLSRPVKPVENLLDCPRLPPLTLSNPSLVAQHTPCTHHLGILPLELACRLFYTMLHEARDWSRNKWWLVDRLVESPHRASLYTRHPVEGNDEAAWQGVTRAWYNGRRGEVSKQFPSPMEEACRIVEKLSMRRCANATVSLEWGGDPDDPDGQGLTWRANFAAANCYEGAKEGVGFHSDRLTSIGPYPTIASLSLGTRRVFRLREVIALDEVGKRAAQTFDIPLPHNSVCACCGEMTTLRPDMKGRQRESESEGSDKGRSPGSAPERATGYWWTCTAGDQNEGKGCGFWKVMDVKAEGRGPFVSR